MMKRKKNKKPENRGTAEREERKERSEVSSGIKNPKRKQDTNKLTK